MQFHRNQSEIISANGRLKLIAYDSVVLDPRLVAVEVYHGWNREMVANADSEALVFASGPTFELNPSLSPDGVVVHGDLWATNGLFPAMNQQAAAERAFISISRHGQLHFGFGRLPLNGLFSMKVFIGGLHALTNHVVPMPASYKGVYQSGLSLADVRIVYGWRRDGRLEILETHDGVFANDLRSVVNRRRFLAAYLPDHASKSRLIIPLVRMWSTEKAAWVSGGRPAITQLPFMLKFVASAPQSGFNRFSQF